MSEDSKDSSLVCPKCGRKVDPDFNVCPFCGKRINKGAVPSSWPFWVALSSLILATFLFFVANVVILYANMQVGGILTFISGIISLASVPFAIMDTLQKKDKIAAWASFGAFAFIALVFLILGIMWLCLIL